MDTLSGERTLVKDFFDNLLKGVYSKRKEFAPKGSKFFPFRVDPFSEKIGEQESKQDVTKLSPLQTVAENLPGVLYPLKLLPSLQQDKERS